MPDAESGTSAEDTRIMRRAITLARRGWGRTAPNPMVGAVVVRNGEMAGEGWHAEYGQPHAEVVALQSVSGSARGASLYVTLEPCSHRGKTPPCVDAILRAGIARVVVGARDPNPVAMGGVERLKEAGVEVQVGVLEQAVLDLDPAYFHAARGADRPFVTLKLALSLDGAIADHTRQRGWLTGQAARKAVHRWRAGADAVAVGIGTALADDPLLTVRYGPPPRVEPLRVVFDRHYRLPVTSSLIATMDKAPLAVVGGGGAKEGVSTRETSAEEQRATALMDAGATVIRGASLAESLRELRAMGVRYLFCEGGAGIAGELLAADMVDRLVIFQAPVLLGAGALPGFGSAPAASAGEAPRWRVVERKAYGADLMSVFAPAGRDMQGG